MKKSFDELEGVELIVDCIYEGGTQGKLLMSHYERYFLNAVQVEDLEK